MDSLTEIYKLLLDILNLWIYKRIPNKQVCDSDDRGGGSPWSMRKKP